jgi:hypothetical protein
VVRLRCTLLTDGPSDRALVPLIRWLLREHRGNTPVDLEFADLGRLADPPKDLSLRIERSIELYPCDVLFVHRDAERASLARRVREIDNALKKSSRPEALPVVSVVPVRMTEAWLLIDEAALRVAAGNPRGRQQLTLPAVRELEGLPDPKAALHDLLREASGLRDRRRRLEHFERDLGRCVQRVAEQIENFSLLRQLDAFRALEKQVIGISEGED